jgi:hypothetical protein
LSICCTNEASVYAAYPWRKTGGGTILDAKRQTKKKETKKDKKKNEAGVLVCILKKGANECTDFSQFWVAKELAERS